MAKGEDITTKFKVDISDLKKGITEANNQIKLANSEFKKASAGMTEWGKSSEGVKAKLTQLKSVLEAQNSKLKSYQEQLKTAQKYEKEASTNVENLRKALDNAKSSYGSNSTEVKKLQTQLSAAEKTEASLKTQVSNLTVTMNNQEATVKSTELQMKNLSGSLTKVEEAEMRAAKNGTSVDDELKKMEDQANKTDGKLGKLASTLTKALAAGAVAAAAGFVALSKSAITAYADYEQLVGGVDTLFKGSSKKVQEYANNAFKTAGLSANDYMETVTSFSASLLQSLSGDTDKAADVANMALTDMADNANKMGTSMGSIQDAYQGFAKQNYTMLDNLKLGYGGTKTEMERLLADATKISGVKYDISNLNDVYQAIHVIQGELGITGTTAKEAATTIQGSTAAMKSAWTNLLVGFADGTQNMDTLIRNFIDSVGTVAENVLPRIGQVMQSVGSIIKEHLPEISSQISQWVSQLLDSIISNLPSGFQELATVIKDGLGIALDGVKAFFSWMIDNGDIVVSLLAGIAAGLAAFNVASTIFGLVEAFKAFKLANEGATVAQWLLNAAMSANPIGIVAIAIGALIAAITLLILNWDKVKEVGGKCWEAIKNAWGSAGEWFKSSVVEPIKNAFNGITEWFGNLFKEAWDKIKYVWDAVQPYFTMIGDNIKVVFSVVKDVLFNFFNLAWIAIKAVWDTVVSYFKAVWDSIALIFSVVKSVLTGDFQGAWDGIKKIVNTWKGFFSGVWNNIKSIFSGVASFFKNSFQTAWNGVKAVFGNVGSFFSGLWNTIKNTFSNLGTSIGDAISGAVKAGINGVISQIEKTINKAINLINGAIGMINKLPGVSVSTISTLNLPRLEKGGILKKGQVGLLEGNGAEAVVPLDKNKMWIKAVADQMKKEIASSNVSAANTPTVAKDNVNNFTQNIYANKPLSRIEIYRQTKNLIALRGGI